MSKQHEQKAKAGRKLYDGVGLLYKFAYGDHVHIGLYEDFTSPSRPSWGEAQTDMVDQLTAMTGLDAADRLIDIGCGHGATALHLARALGCRAVGVNISEYQARRGRTGEVEQAALLAQQQGLGARAEFVVADGQRPPYGDGQFDLAVSVESAAYMADKKLFISELARMLQPGGRLLLADFCRADGDLSASQLASLRGIDRAFKSAGNWTSAAQYKELMAANGLTVIAEDDWTGRIRGFWDLSVHEMLLRRGPAEEAAWRARGWLRNFWILFCKIMFVEWTIMINLFMGRGGPWWMAVVGVFLGCNRRTMHRAFGCGALRYATIAAVKAPAGSPEAAAAAAAAAGKLRARAGEKAAAAAGGVAAVIVVAAAASDATSALGGSASGSLGRGPSSDGASAGGEAGGPASTGGSDHV
ncbi:MAG: S-adenosyl-L-methionine-dependent methyltransferase [Monoraphidium minutum]|nr:MAG: S-adenosyl-L-methionine-dependent methyltransferase [Monoraphidium minutum]